MTTLQRMTYEDLLAQPDNGMLHELVRGEIIEMPPPSEEHGRVEFALAGAIDRYLSDRAITLGWHPEDGRRTRDRLVGYPASGEVGFRFALPGEGEQVRGVDLLYLSPEQYAQFAQRTATGYLTEVPALAVEVISPSETSTYSNEKVTDYLAAGVRVVWQLFPKTKSVRIFRSDGTTSTIPPGDSLEGEDVLPGFKVRLSQLFD